MLSGGHGHNRSRRSHVFHRYCFNGKNEWPSLNAIDNNFSYLYRDKESDTTWLFGPRKSFSAELSGDFPRLESSASTLSGSSEKDFTSVETGDKLLSKKSILLSPRRRQIQISLEDKVRLYFETPPDRKLKLFQICSLAYLENIVPANFLTESALTTRFNKSYTFQKPFTAIPISYLFMRRKKVSR